MVDAADGSLAAAYQYDPFGQLISSTGPMVNVNPFRWSTKYHDDETGLVAYQLRDYSPDLARWISKDPVGEDYSLNLYAFIDNNSVNDWDYLGQFTLDQALRKEYLERTSSTRAHHIQSIPAFNRGFLPWKAKLADKEIYDFWIKWEKTDTSWRSNLPMPPACLVKQGGSYALPTGFSSKWKQPARIKFKKYHPKGVWEIRTKSANSSGSGNQAVYDTEGRILTGGYSAGSADRRQADSTAVTILKLGKGGHIKEDVEPFDFALDLDNGYGTNVQLYLSVRPTIVPEGANPNVLDPF